MSMNFSRTLGALLPRCHQSRMAPSKPLIAVIGATGTGKSELAVQIARRYNGEVINGDAMQLYDGLPIITNKIPAHERVGVPHHLLGRIGLHEETWTVARFVREATQVIDDVHRRGRLPVLVGGTHYYTQSLLFHDALVEGGDHDGEWVDDTKRQWPILDEPTDQILQRLREVDPVMADRWHPNDRRKIQRSLEIWLKTGRKASEVYDEQSVRRRTAAAGTSEQEGDSLGANPMRYHTLLLWVHADADALRDRLDERVDAMVDGGLLDEVATLDSFLRKQETHGTVVDRSKGIWVSIGFKEFQEYQTTLLSGTASDKRLEALKQEGIVRTQAATRRYAKRQIRWIRIKLLAALASAGVPDNLYLLDGSDVARWETEVREPGEDLVRKFLSGMSLRAPASLSDSAREMLVPRKFDHSERRDLWIRRTCEVCGTVVVTETDWNKHLKGRGHRRAVAARLKKSVQLRPERAMVCREDSLDAEDLLATSKG